MLFRSEVEFTPVKPKRKPRKPKDAFKGEILVPALEKRDAFVEPSKLRKDRLKEKIECPNGCGKLITRHAASYTHDKTCPALKRRESEIQTEEIKEIVVKEPDFDRKEAEKRLRKPRRCPPMWNSWSESKGPPGRTASSRKPSIRR